MEVMGFMGVKGVDDFDASVECMLGREMIGKVLLSSDDVLFKSARRIEEQLDSDIATLSRSSSFRIARRMSRKENSGDSDVQISESDTDRPSNWSISYDFGYLEFNIKTRWLASELNRSLPLSSLANVNEKLEFLDNGDVSKELEKLYVRHYSMWTSSRTTLPPVWTIMPMHDFDKVNWFGSGLPKGGARGLFLMMTDMLYFSQWEKDAETRFRRFPKAVETLSSLMNDCMSESINRNDDETLDAIEAMNHVGDSEEKRSPITVMDNETIARNVHEAKRQAIMQAPLLLMR